MIERDPARKVYVDSDVSRDHIVAKHADRNASILNRKSRYGFELKLA